jgi:hypothetical protein
LNPQPQPAFSKAVPLLSPIESESHGKGTIR